MDYHPLVNTNNKGEIKSASKQTRDADAPQVYRLTESRVPRPVPGLEHLLPS